jgi:hypothetical protein
MAIESSAAGRAGRFSPGNFPAFRLIRLPFFLPSFLPSESADKPREREPLDCAETTRLIGLVAVVIVAQDLSFP